MIVVYTTNGVSISLHFFVLLQLSWFKQIV